MARTVGEVRGAWRDRRGTGRGGHGRAAGPRLGIVPDDLLAELVGLLPVGVFALDDDGRVVLWNATAERLTGWSGSEMMGRSVIARDPTGRASVMFDEQTTARIVEEIRSGRTVR